MHQIKSFWLSKEILNQSEEAAYRDKKIFMTTKPDTTKIYTYKEV